MKKNKELIKNTLIIAIGKICTQFISFILLPLYTNILSTNEYGEVDLITTYVSLFVPLITLQIEMAVFRFLIEYRKDKKRQSDYIYNSISIVIKTTLILSIIYILVMSIIDYKYRWYLLIIIISTIYSNVLLQIARGIGDNLGFAIGSIIAGVTTLILNCLLLKIFNFGIEGMLISISVANLLCSIFIFLRENIYHNIKYGKKNNDLIKEMIKYSIPLIPNGIMWWIINVSDRTIISFILGTTSNGIYAISNKFSNLFVSLYNIYSLSWTEQASLHIKDKDKNEYFSEMLNKSIIFFFSLSIGIIGCMPYIFPLMIDDKYIESYIYIPILMLGMFFNVLVSLLGAIYIAEKKTKEVAKTSIYSAIINIVINLIFVKYIGIWATVISTAVAFMLMFIYRIIDVQKYVKVKFDILMYCEMIVVFFLVCIAYYVNNTIINIIALILIFIYFIIKNKQFIDDFLKIIFGKFKMNVKKQNLQ